MKLAVIIGAVIAALVLGLFGLLVYASPNPTDQFAGRLMMGGAVVVIVLTFFHQNPYVAVVLKVVIVVTLLGTIWLLWSMFGRSH